MHDSFSNDVAFHVKSDYTAYGSCDGTVSLIVQCRHQESRKTITYTHKKVGK